MIFTEMKTAVAVLLVVFQCWSEVLSFKMMLADSPSFLLKQMNDETCRLLIKVSVHCCCVNQNAEDVIAQQAKADEAADPYANLSKKEKKKKKKQVIIDRRVPSHHCEVTLGCQVHSSTPCRHSMCNKMSSVEF